MSPPARRRSRPPPLAALLPLLPLLAAGGAAGKATAAASWLGDDFKLSRTPFGMSMANFSADGGVILSIREAAPASQFISKSSYKYGVFTMIAKLMPGYSAGVCATFFLMSAEYANRDEWDFEFLGNTQGKGIQIQTNWWAGGVGEHEERIDLWFDPSAAFHNYTIDWSPTRTVWTVDGKKIRQVSKVTGQPYPEQHMDVLGSIWDASGWATGPADNRIPIDWNYQPFSVHYKQFHCKEHGSMGRQAQKVRG
eukprot:SM000034S12713  [mRNA]  locus=s34:366637:368194:- [translate_table: standard]